MILRRLAEHKFGVNYIYEAFVERDDGFFSVRNNRVLKGKGRMRNSCGESFLLLPFVRGVEINWGDAI